MDFYEYSLSKDGVGSVLRQECIYAQCLAFRENNSPRSPKGTRPRRFHAGIRGDTGQVVCPVLKLLSCPLIIVTLGLFVLVINGITLWLASAIAVGWFRVGFQVDDFWAAFLGALIVSIVSVVLSAVVREEKE